MSEFRIGKLGKKILRVLKEGGAKIETLFFEIYSKKYANGEGIIWSLPFSKKVSVYSAVRRLEKRKLIESQMSYSRNPYLIQEPHPTKYIWLSKLGEEYISKHLIKDT